jgi:hypothetical protein
MCSCRGEVLIAHDAGAGASCWICPSKSFLHTTHPYSRSSGSSASSTSISSRSDRVSGANTRFLGCPSTSPSCDMVVAPSLTQRFCAYNKMARGEVDEGPSARVKCSLQAPKRAEGSFPPGSGQNQGGFTTVADSAPPLLLTTLWGSQNHLVGTWHVGYSVTQPQHEHCTLQLTKHSMSGTHAHTRAKTIPMAL